MKLEMFLALQVTKFYSIVQFQKISIPTPWKDIGNSEGMGVSKAKHFKGKYIHVAKLKFLEGWGGVKPQKTLP